MPKPEHPNEAEDTARTPKCYIEIIRPAGQWALEKNRSLEKPATGRHCRSAFPAERSRASHTADIPTDPNRVTQTLAVIVLLLSIAAIAHYYPQGIGTFPMVRSDQRDQCY
jgi:hypothetical protein